MVRTGSAMTCTFVLAAAALMAAAAPATGPSQDLWLEATLEPAQVYVQAQAVYRLRFYQAVDVRELQISGPSTRLAEVRQIGAERVHEAQREGRRYRVRERSYAVFPFGSGALTLSGAQVNGRFAADGRQALRLEAPSQTLTVLPAPATAGSAPWLPANSLTLSEHWSTPDSEIQTGQTLQRSIRIEAAGIDAAQIPPLQVAAAGLLVEAQAARLENRLAGERNIGVREQSFRLVALRAGTIQVPELTLHWWNLATDAPARATLPARSLQVAPADAAPADIRPMAQAASAAQPAPVQAQATLLATSKPGLLLAFGALLSTGLALAYVRRLRVRAAWRLRRACRSGDASALRDALLQWTATVWPQAAPSTLEALAQRLPDPAARGALAKLDRCLYGPQRGRCDVAALRATVRAVKADVAAQQNMTMLS